MFRSILLAAIAIAFTACATEGGTIANQAVLDFARPPSQLHPARLVMLNGRNVNAPISRTSFWVDPGKHEIVIAAGIGDSMQVGTTPTRRGSTDPGRVTIDVEAGKRYRIAARVLDQRGLWEPVVWRVDDM